MDQVGYQGYAQTTGFNPVKVSNANVEAIARDGQRTLKGMEAYAKQDIKNRQEQLNAIVRNTDYEEKNRQQRFDAETQDRQRYQDAITRNYKTEIRSIETRGNNAASIFKDLSHLSTTAGTISSAIISDIERERETGELWAQVVFGISHKELMSALKAEHAVMYGGEAIEIKADQLEAMGADPIAVNAMRAQNPARIVRDKKARVAVGKANLSAYVAAAYEDDRFVVNIKLPDGTFKQIKASEAVTSEEKAAVFPEIYKRFLVENELHTLKPTMLASLHEAAYNQFTSLVNESRKLELDASKLKRLEGAKDYLTDTKTVEAFHAFHRELVRQKGYQVANEELFKFVALSTDGQGNMLFDRTQLNEFKAQAFYDQPSKAIGDRYSAQWFQLESERRRAEVGFINEITQSTEAQHDKWTTETEQFVQQNVLSKDELDSLIDTANRTGNEKGVKMLQNYLQYTPEVQQENATIAQFEEYQALGTLRVEQVQRSQLSPTKKIEWLKKAKENEASAMSKEGKDRLFNGITNALKGRIKSPSIDSTSHRTYDRARYHALRQAMADYQIAIQKPGATEQDALEYAEARFEKEFTDEKNGKYRVDQNADSSKPYEIQFPQFAIAGRVQMEHPATQLSKEINGKDSALDEKLLINESELKRVAADVAAGRKLIVPKEAQLIANIFGNKYNSIDVLNRQLKRAGLPQVPLESYRQKSISVNPEYQRLLNYRPNSTRLTIAGIGSGMGTAPAPRRIGAVNNANEILSTFLAAGGSPEQAALMTAIAMAESNGRQDATRSDTDVHGWFQVRYPVHVDKLRALGITSRSQLLDPMNNSKAAIAILNSQGLGAWEAYTNGSYKQFLPAAQRALGSYGDGIWRQGMTMRPRLLEYITGDRSHPRYRSDHGGGNYHEHLAYATPAEALIAARKLEAQGIKVTQLQGHSAVGKHSDNSYHYDGRAFDVPADQVPVGQEKELSRRVRAILGIN